MSASSRPIALVLLLISSTSSFECKAGDWLTLPSTYTHDPTTGQRVDQYAQNKPSVSNVQSSYRTSGYRQYRSTIQYGQAADNYHRVEKWGEPVRPYGEWRFPARPYSSPYPVWGAPLAGMNIGGFNRGFGHGGGHGYGYGNQPPIAGLTVPNENPATGMGPFPDRRPGQGQIPNPFGPGGASLTPYPHIPSSGYPSPPYYDGYHPNYGESPRPRLDDRRFYYKPTQEADTGN